MSFERRFRLFGSHRRLAEGCVSDHYEAMSNLPNFVHARQLPAPPNGWYDHWYAPLNDGRLGLVRIDRDLVAAPIQWSEWPNARLLVSSFNGEIEEKAIEVPAVRGVEIDRLADSRWIVVASRAERGEANARIFAADGSLLQAFEVGDGIQQIASATDGRIWIGYFDEGVYSPSHEDGSRSPASYGLAAFTASGECHWKFASDGYHIDDCYALSVSGPTVWACTYSDFPVIRLDETGVRIWKNGVSRGAHAIAGRGHHVVLAGGYNSNKARLALLRLDKSEAMLVAEFHLTGATGKSPFMRGRDGVIHAIMDDQWLRIDIGDWLTSRD